MAFTLTVVEHWPQYVRIKVAGPVSLRNYVELIEEAAADTSQQEEKHVLIDCRAMVGRLKSSDEAFVGEILGQKLAHLYKLATVVADDPGSYNSMKVASKNGLTLRNFGSEDEASAWLSDGVI
jgi:hypothetical protein